MKGDKPPDSGGIRNAHWQSLAKMRFNASAYH